jgi:hypothetical protein
MTPKEKAEELVEDYRNAYPTYTSNRLNLHQAKRCALIAVNEILKNDTIFLYVHHLDFWKEVKHELEKL